jgi:hypothetical protein
MKARFVAELGIIFLMFMVGLEFSLSAMIAAGREVFGAGSLQVGFTVFYRDRNCGAFRCELIRRSKCTPRRGNPSSAKGEIGVSSRARFSPTTALGRPWMGCGGSVNAAGDE